LRAAAKDFDLKKNLIEYIIKKLKRVCQMSKVYAAILNKEREKVLVGKGGTVGRHHHRREGYSLPGGTIDGTRKNSPVNDCGWNQLNRELYEEFGETTRNLIMRDGGILTSHNALINFRSCENMRHACSRQSREFVNYGHRIYYYFIEVAGTGWFCGNVTDGIRGNPEDSAYDSIEELAIDDAIYHFRSDIQKNWFAYILERVGKNYSGIENIV
ncbi:MAG: hypothetical protein AAFZ92_10945, partial [Pseudomonadota bacterium]